MDLGFSPPSDQFLSVAQLQQSETYYPLNVYMCDACGLAQLGYVVPPEILYQNEYPYESSTTATGQAHWSAFARSVVQECQLTTNSLVVDIGSNVGVLLSAFKDLSMRVQGVDPAPNIVEIANGRGIDTICDFFSMKSVEAIIEKKGHASLVTGTNVFAHVDNLDSFVTAVFRLLEKDGVFVFEAPYLVDLIKKIEYDTIYHEHLSYISVKPLIQFFKKFGMEVFDIHRTEIHGGSIRVFVQKQSRYAVSNRVGHLLAIEDQEGIYSHENLKVFANRVYQHRDELTWLLKSLKKEGKKIAAVSAPAKGMTLLNYCRIGAEYIDFVTEKSRLKIGRFTPGVHIPVVPDSELLKHKPDYALVLAWNFADEIIKNLDDYRKQGGKFIVPIPKPTVIE